MKKIKKIKNIEKSKFCKKINDKIGQDKVKFWQFKISMEEVEYLEPEFRKMKSRFHFERIIKGRNDIRWDILQKEINYINSRYNKLKTENNFITCVNLKNIFNEFSGSVLTGKIVLESGDYITIREEYDHYEDSYALEVRKHKIPRIEVKEDLEILDFSKEIPFNNEG